MKTQLEHAELTAHDSVAILALNHPLVMNAVSPAMIRSLSGALDLIEGDARFRALILTGAGKAFCAGADLSLPSGDVPDTGALLEQVYHPFLRRLRDLRMPLVMAVNGAAVGIGMSLALSGDLVIAARSAFFQQGFTRIGLVPDGGSTWLLPRLVGLARARELALLAEMLPAQKALDWGLINFVADDETLMDEALRLAEKLAHGPAALALTRKLFWESQHNSYEGQLALEQAAQRKAGASADFREGLKAFREKRPPRFTGK